MGIRGKVVWECVTSSCLGPHCKQEQGNQERSTPTLSEEKKAKLLFSENQMVLFSSVFSPVWLIYRNSSCCSKLSWASSNIMLLCHPPSRLNMFTLTYRLKFYSTGHILWPEGAHFFSGRDERIVRCRIGWRSWPAEAQASPCTQITREASWNDLILSSPRWRRISSLLDKLLVILMLLAHRPYFEKHRINWDLNLAL